MCAVLSSLRFEGQRAVDAVRWGRWLRIGLLGLMALWAVASITRLPPLHDTAVTDLFAALSAAVEAVYTRETAAVAELAGAIGRR